jgi:hypothetical protein
MSKLEVDKIDPQSGTDLELGSSGDTVTIPTGVTLDASNATTTLPATVVTTTGTQTLTNKSIDSDNNTITNIVNADIKAGAAIDYSKLNLTGNIALADLSATGTKDATTFLRGDNTFATPTDNGKVLQVVSTFTTSAVVTTSTSYIDINLSLNITPSATSSKIFVIYTGTNETNGTSGNRLAIQMLRDATQIADSDGIGTLGSTNGVVTSASISKLDQPSTISQITYKMQGKSNDGTVMVFNLGSSTGTLTAFEIAG